jgi:hypothetical protein
MDEKPGDRPPGLDRKNRKVPLAALSRAVRVHWDHEKARPVPEHLAELAATADEACCTKHAEGTVEGCSDLTQVKDRTSSKHSKPAGASV